MNVIKFAEAQEVDLILWEANEGHMVANEIAQAGVPVILDPLNNIPSTFDSLNATYENVTRLNDAGVVMAFYYEQGAGAHNAYLATQSAGNSVAMGLDYNEAISSITSNPADIFGLINVGYILPGYDADLVVWDNDPLELMSSVEMVMIDGEKQDLSNRYKELTDRYTKELDKTACKYICIPQLYEHQLIRHDDLPSRFRHRCQMYHRYKHQILLRGPSNNQAEPFRPLLFLYLLNP